MPIEGYNLSTTLVQGWIPLALGDARVWDSTNNMGALLSTATSPKLDVISTGQSSVSMPTVAWSSAVVVPIIWPGVILPIDFSTADGISVHLLVSKSSNSDTGATIGVDFITNVAFSSVTSSKIDALAATDYVTTLSSANAGAALSGLAVRITPGTHAVDSIRLHGAGISYGRKRRG